MTMYSSTGGVVSFPERKHVLPEHDITGHHHFLPSRQPDPVALSATLIAHKHPALTWSSQLVTLVLRDVYVGGRAEHPQV
jgi:hypothetical protein